jgi:glycosyltransferase involved in cell wall biosynthesis
MEKRQANRLKGEGEHSTFPGLSVVVLHYNRPWCLEICVSSLRQAFNHWQINHEIIVADDGSDPDLFPLLDRFPFDRIYIQQKRFYDDRHSSVYNTIQAAIELAKYPFLLFLEDDFWLIPQGFRDRDKNHINGLLSQPCFNVDANPFSGAIELLMQLCDAHFVELARSFTNPRYHCFPNTEQCFCGVPFQAKSQSQHPRFYSCDWPNIQRTSDALSIPLPLGCTCWDGELEVSRLRCKRYGNHNWVYNPKYCYFAHMNIFTWREVYNRSGAENHMHFPGEADETSVPYRFKPVKGFNTLLLQGFKRGIIRNDPEAYFSMNPMEYVYTTLYRKVCS